MTKHNNVIPNQHFKKKWQFYVKTWFNQPARKVRRRNGRHPHPAFLASGNGSSLESPTLLLSTPSLADWTLLQRTWPQRPLRQ